MGDAGHCIVALAPALPIVGAWVSTIVMVWLTVALWLPHEFVASQLLVTVVGQPVPPVTSPRMCIVVPPQASEAVGGVNVGEAGHSIVALSPGLPMVGVGQFTVTFAPQGA